MDSLKRRILARVGAPRGEIVPLDSFLNQQLDLDLLADMGRALAAPYRGTGITRVVTVESSGVPLAIFIALALDVPVVYAKQYTVGQEGAEMYSAEAQTFATGQTYILHLPKAYLSEEDVVLLTDDVLSSGQAVLALAEIAAKAGAQVAGCAVAMEKIHRHGAQALAAMGIPVTTLLTLDRIENGRAIWAEN